MRRSFSQWENYAGCPRRWKHEKLDKLPKGDVGPAANRGKEVHDKIERYILGKADELPVNHFGSTLDYFRSGSNGTLYTEFELHFDSKWAKTHPDAGNARWIVILDALLIRGDEAEIGEWKTGKPKDTHRDQRTLYSLAVIRAFGVKKVTATTTYFDNTAPPARLVVKDTAAPKLIKIWNQRDTIMAKDTFWPPRPGMHCRWCSYAKDKGGPCIFSG